MSSGSGVLNTPFELVTGLGFAGFVLLLLAMPLAFWAVASQSRAGVVRLLVAVANLLFTAQLILRWWQSGHFPISNLYESLCFLAWACTLTQLLVERAWPSPIVAAAATPMGLGCIAFASFALPDQLQSAAPLVPALRSSWLVYAAYLHTRLSRGWQGRRPALVAVVGLVVIAVCYIGVNLLGIGLHSYGWFF